MLSGADLFFFPPLIRSPCLTILQRKSPPGGWPSGGWFSVGGADFTGVPGLGRGCPLLVLVGGELGIWGLPCCPGGQKCHHPAGGRVADGFLWAGLPSFDFGVWGAWDLGAPLLPRRAKTPPPGRWPSGGGAVFFHAAAEGLGQVSCGGGAGGSSGAGFGSVMVGIKALAIFPSPRRLI